MAECTYVGQRMAKTENNKKMAKEISRDDRSNVRLEIKRRKKGHPSQPIIVISTTVRLHVYYVEVMQPNRSQREKE